MSITNATITFVLFSISLTVSAIDLIPEDLSSWKEHGTVLQNNPSILWEEKLKISIAGSAKLNSTYYLFYLAGFDGRWKKDSGSNHQSLGVATSHDGITYTKHTNNPVLKPHDFLPVSSEEEGIRTAYIRYLPSQKMFYGFFGVESPGGSNTCPFRAGKFGWISWFCKGDTEVDAAIFHATSVDGINWNKKGLLQGTYKKGSEVYASDWLYDGSNFFLYVTTAQGGQFKTVSKGQNPLKLKGLGEAKPLNWGWSGLTTFLHDDNKTVTLIYDPIGGDHPGAENQKLYFATSNLNDLTKIENERAISDTPGSKSKHSILKDEHEWKWYYVDETAHNRSKIRLRTHPIQ